MRKIIIKEGPLVFLRDVLVMEVLASIIFYFAALAANYEQLYLTIFISKYIRYNSFMVIAFSFFQLTYISILFLNWYFSHYEIMDKEIIKKSGLIFRRRKSVSMSEVASVEVYQSPLSRFIKHATIILEHTNGRVTKFKNVAGYEEYVHIIKQIVHNVSGRIPTRDPKTLIADGESNYVEFKETLRYDTRRGEVNKEMEKMVLKTIVGFLNADGGTLIIGVNDNGDVVGLENDYKALPKKNRDGFENHLSMLVKTMIGLSFSKYIGVKFDKIDDKDICTVTVREGHKPAYLINGDKKEDFYVRVGNSTQPFSMSEASDYIKTNWG